MADILDNAEFWLPSHFLAEDDILVHNQILAENGVNADFRANLSFPRHYDSLLSSTALNSPIESVLSPGTEVVAEESLFAELTRQLARSAIQETQKLATEEKTWILSGSPKSTLSAHGSWGGTPTTGPSRKTSPAATPRSGRNVGWDVIYAAAAQVARLKMARERSMYPQSGGLRDHSGDLSSDLSSFPAKKPASGFLTHSSNQNLRYVQAMKQQIHQSQLQQQQIQCRVKAFDQENVMLPRSAFQPQQQKLHPPRHRPAYAGKAVFLSGGSGGGGGGKESAGTGVFLPRRYGNTIDSRKKPGFSSVLLPSNTNSPAQACSNNNAHVPLYDSLMARRHALFVEQQKRSVRSDMAVGSEIRLPQEWTY